MDCQFSKFPIAFCSCCLIEVYRTLISVFLKFRLSRNKLFIPLCNTADHPTNNCIRNAYFAETVNRTGVGPLGWRAFNSSTAVFTGLASKKKNPMYNYDNNFCNFFVFIFAIKHQQDGICDKNSAPSISSISRLLRGGRRDELKNHSIDGILGKCRRGIFMYGDNIRSTDRALVIIRKRNILRPQKPPNICNTRTSGSL